MSVFGITSRNPGQKELIETILDKNYPVVFVTGNAGTGKSLITLASCLHLVDKNKYEKIIYTRDLVQLGAEVGFIKGDLDAKVLPYMICLQDSLDVITKQNFNKSPIKGAAMNNDWSREYIDIQPLIFMRGRSLNNCILIVDEAQNLDMNTIKTLLTRMGEDSKIILLGDKLQIDNRRQRTGMCDFEKAIGKLEEEKFVKVVHLTKSERSPICARIDELLSE